MTTKRKAKGKRASTASNKSDKTAKKAATTTSVRKPTKTVSKRGTTAKRVVGAVMAKVIYPASATITLLNPPPWLLGLAKQLVGAATGTMNLATVRGESVVERHLRAERIAAIPLAETRVIILLLEHRKLVYDNRKKVGELESAITSVVRGEFGAHEIDAILSQIRAWVLQLSLPAAVTAGRTPRPRSRF